MLEYLFILEASSPFIPSSPSFCIPDGAGLHAQTRQRALHTATPNKGLQESAVKQAVGGQENRSRRRSSGQLISEGSCAADHNQSASLALNRHRSRSGGVRLQTFSVIQTQEARILGSQEEMRR